MITTMKRRTFCALATSLLAAAAIACGDDDSTAGTTSTASTTYTGSVSGTQLSVAAVVEGGRALVYVCDGHNGRRIDATLTNGSYKGDVAGLGTLDLELGADALTGTIVVPGGAGTGTGAADASYPFTASKASGSAKLLWATGDRNGTPISAGWIVASDGKETGGVVRGITDGTSNTLRPTEVPGSSYVEQDNIISALLGSRAPIVRP